MTGAPLEAIDGGRAPSGWEGLWASDRWSLRELPHADLQSIGRDGAILFDRIAQPWLKEAAKRWARARLSAGRGAEHDGSLRGARCGVQRLARRPGGSSRLAG